jgi:nucleoside-diphosphate-sugar epimerase
VSGPALPDDLAAALRTTDHRILVTGAGGWIGSATLHMLNSALGPDAFKRRVRAFAGRARTLSLMDGTEVLLLPLEALGEIKDGPSLLFHYAFLGKERVADMPLADYVAANARITAIVRGAVQRLRPAGMFLTSSGAVYRADRSIESDLAANPYGVLKHRDETVFAEACAASGVKLVTARVFNLSGEYINKVTSYALSSFILDALAGRPITVRAKRRVERSYVYAGDVVRMALACLLDRAPAPPVFDTAGGQVVELGELAELVRKACGLSDSSILRDEFDTAAQSDRYVGDPAIMEALAGSKQMPIMPLAPQIELTAGYLGSVPPKSERRCSRSWGINA